MRSLELVAGIRLDYIHADKEVVEGTDTGNSGTNGDSRRLFTGEPRVVGIDKDILRVYLVRWFTYPSEEVL